MSILFSPIGGTDPITNYRDGAMLHICRKYLPDKVYLYLSGEMCREHDLHNPYVYSLEKLGELTGHTFQYEVIRREELTEVQLFDTFVEDYRQILNNIQKEHPEEEIIVNVSSGTPAMKSSLLILAILSDGKYLPVQVSTPKRKMNPDRQESRDDDPEINWELNEDNGDEYEDRTSVVHSGNWSAEIKKEIVKKHIQAYDYVAAGQVAAGIPGMEAMGQSLIQAAVYRLKLDFRKMDKLVNGKEFTSAFIPVRESNKRSLVEYALGLDIRLKKEEYADFLRALSPILVDIYKAVLIKEFRIDVDKEYTAPHSKGGLRWSGGKLMENQQICSIFDNEYDRKFDYAGRVESAHLALLIDKLPGNAFAKDRIRLLRKAELELRNVAAHQMISITRDTIKETIGVWPEDVMKAIKEVLDRYVTENRENIWESYDVMNRVILDHLR